jgi:hypothetical protein
MFRWINDIGCAAGILPFHASRLIIDGNDQAGAGSATLDDERADDPNIVGDEDLGDGDFDDDQPRGRRDKQVKAYDALKSDRDRLAADLAKKDELLTSLSQRLDAVEKTAETRQDVNSRTNASIERAKQRAREVVGEIKKLDRNDPDYSVKVYEAMFTHLDADYSKAAEEVSERKSREVYQETRTHEQRRADAEQEALEHLEDAGLDKEHLRLVQLLASEKSAVDPNWFKNTPAEKQVPLLVEEVVKLVRGPKRNSQDFKDEKKRHREPMDGVIDSSSRGTRRSPREDDDDQREGPGSILADLARLKKTQRQSTNTMLRQAER